MTSILLNSPEIRTNFAQVLKSVIYAIDFANRDGSFYINSNTAKAANKLCDTISQKAGPELRRDIAIFKSELNHGSLLPGMEIDSVE
jgi:hypothetical protein